MALGRAVLTSKINQAQVQRVPAVLLPQQLQIDFCLLYALAISQAPALSQSAANQAACINDGDPKIQHNCTDI